MRLSVIATAICLSIVGISTAQDAEAAIRRPTHIAAQGLAPALQMLAKERDVQVVYRSEVVRDQRTSGATGDLTFDEALTQLLSGTGLTYRYLDDKAITIVAVGSSTGIATTSSLTSEQSGTTEPASPHARAGGQGGGDSSGDPSNKSFWDRFRLAQVDQGAPASSPTVTRKDEQASTNKPVQLEEVLVTAQKREERLIDTPQSVSVVSADDLTKLGATQFRDFANTVPGLTFSTQGAGYTQVSLRGVTAGTDIGPTVGIYVDEVPYGSSTPFAASSNLALDVALFDLDRIEVLRGPQGTLYGASTMGGLLKYVTNRPDATGFSGDVQTGISGTRDGGVSYNIAGVINAPLIAGKAAVRASAFESRDGGYIDNFALARQDVNRSDIYGGHLDLLLTPSDALTVRLVGFLQDISRDGQANADYTFAGVPTYGRLDQYRKSPEPFDQHLRLVSGTVGYDFGPATLTSISSYQTTQAHTATDATGLYAPLLAQFGLGSYSAVGFPVSLSTDKITQEVRLASDGHKPIEWLIGAFYTRENSENAQSLALNNLAGQSVPDTLYSVSIPTRFEEYSAFGDLTWHLTSKFDVSGGVRYAQNRQKFQQIGSGPLAGSAPANSSTETVVTYLADARYHLSDYATGYLRYATGYRPGGPNLVAKNPATGLPIGPATFQSDSLKSYEAGYKAETADRRLGIDLAAYFIDWSDIQVLTTRGGFSVYANAPHAAIRGAELTLTARPINALTTTGAFAYQDARLSAASPDVGGADGERLPNVPRFTAAVNADYALVGTGVRPTVGATVRYVDARSAAFDNSPGTPQYHVPDYVTVDLRAAFTIGSVNAQVYVHNLFDNLGQLSAFTYTGSARVAFLQTRTIGIAATARF